jgi:hypothetical protein
MLSLVGSVLFGKYFFKALPFILAGPFSCLLGDKVLDPGLIELLICVVAWMLSSYLIMLIRTRWVCVFILICWVVSGFGCLLRVMIGNYST